MPVVEKSIVVQAPVERVFELWTHVERFPEFMANVKEVARRGRDRTHWKVEAAGQDVEWDARMTTTPVERVEWDAEGKNRQHGVVTFDALGPDRTRVNVRMDYHLPSRWKERGASWFGIDAAVVENDLTRFKDLVETGETDVTHGPYRVSD